MNGVSCHLAAVRGTPTFNLLASPAIWWRSVELQRGNVTLGLKTGTVKVHSHYPSSRVAIFRYSDSQISIPEVRYLPQISAIAVPHPTKFHIQGQ